MDQKTPVRGRFHLKKPDPHTPTPTRQSSWESTSIHQFGLRKSNSFPYNGSKYWSFRSIGLESPEIFSPSAFSPKRPRDWGFSYGRHQISRLFKAFSIRRLLMLLVLMSLFWWFERRSPLDQEPRPKSLRKELQATRGMRFVTASDRKIHYVGRWTSTPNQLRKDGTFPGIYFDVDITKTSSLFLSLQNSPLQLPSKIHFRTPKPISTVIPSVHPNLAHLKFRHSAELDKPSPPVSILARIDQEEYVLLPNSSSLVKISMDLEPSKRYLIRIIFPMIEQRGKEVVQFEGLWMDKYGSLSRVEGSGLDFSIEDEDFLELLDINKSNEYHKRRWSGTAETEAIQNSDFDITTGENDEPMNPITQRRKVLEIVTDHPGFIIGKSRGNREDRADGILAGVMSWEYILGEMFGADHIAIGVDGMCLTQGCIGGVGEPAGLGDVFFRSAPPHSGYFERPWMFHSHLPDVILLNLGASDAASFIAHEETYNKTMLDLYSNFESTYVSFVKAIRQLAYPNSKPSSRKAYTSTPSDVPIFIMRPFDGSLEHATQGAVNRLRADGDSSVFWLDTSGWLIPPSSTDPASTDYSLDTSVNPPVHRLTEQGNQKVAVFLHAHVCRFLASNGEKCPFLAPDVYEGKLSNPEDEALERWMENEKEKGLKEAFFKDER